MIFVMSVSFGFLVYEQSNPSQKTKHTLAYLLNDDNFDKFNQAQKDRYNELSYVSTDLSEEEIQNKADEYWNCMMGTPTHSSTCIPYDEEYVLDEINGLIDISRYEVICDSECSKSLDRHYEIDEKLKIFQNETLHKKLFDDYVSITPKIISDELIYLYITTDDYGGNEAAATFRDGPKSLKYALSIDPVDMAPSASIVDEQFHKGIMIHENAHILSLGSTQTDNDVLYYDNNEELREMMKNKQISCTPNYFSYGAGCLKEKSYLNLFFQKFWIDTHIGFKPFFEFDNHNEFLEHNAQFYAKYQDQFVSDYAALNPEEDFAESFSAFILKEKPTKSTITDQKILFFYEFPEMIKIRDFIRSNL